MIWPGRSVEGSGLPATAGRAAKPGVVTAEGGATPAGAALAVG
jgi:hypothetical protein